MSSIAVAWNPRVANTSHATSRGCRGRCSAGRRTAMAATVPVGSIVAVASSGSLLPSAVASSRFATAVSKAAVAAGSSAAALQGHLVAVGDAEVVAPSRVDLGGLVRAQGQVGRRRVLAHLARGYARRQ